MSALSPQQEEEYKIAFQFFDKQNTGRLDKNGAQLLLRSIGEDPNSYPNLCKYEVFQIWSISNLNFPLPH
jgi:hypothetical protein